LIGFFHVTLVGQEKEINLAFIVNGVNFEMIFVEGGAFMMGCTAEQTFCYGDEKNIHNVELSDFYIGKYQVTQKLWNEVMGRSIRTQLYLANSKVLNGEGAEYPIYYVTYNESLDFCSKLNKLLSKQLPKGYKFCLPTEAQWEYAARGGNKSDGYRYSGGNEIDEIAWYEDNSNKHTHKVGTKVKNELGIFDMCGNVFEWCLDWYGDFYYEKSPLINPKGPDSGTARVVRGGSWNTKPHHCRVSFRHGTSPSNRSFDNGFRVVLSP
jgi:formylglycine-generating enzyme required for sulfatase activity